MTTADRPEIGQKMPTRFAGMTAAELLILAAILAAAAAVRIRLLGVPLERDEGGFAYIARLILHGSPIYHDAYDFKPPGLYLSYAAMMALFGQTPAGIHTGFLIVNLASVLLLFRIAKGYLDRWSSLATAFIFAFLGVTPGVLGFAGHASHLVVFWMLAGLCLLRRNRGTIGGRRLLRTALAGVLFGLSGMMKQPGVLFLPAGLAVIFWNRPDGGKFRKVVSEMLLFLAGAIGLAALLACWVAVAGDFSQFLFWNFRYGSEFGSYVGVGDAFRQCAMVFVQVMGNNAIVWLIGAAGLLFCCFDIRKDRSKLTLLIFAIVSFAAVSAGFMYRSHYFVMLLPAVALFGGYAIGWAGTKLHPAAQVMLILLTVTAAGWGMAAESGYYFSDRPETISQKIYAPNIFFKAGEIADTIRAETSANDRVAILGSEPEVLFLADRLSATPYIFTYFLMEIQPDAERMQNECIAQITAARPAMILLVRQQFSWSIRPQSVRTILDWMTPFLKAGYDPVGLVDLVGRDSVETRWGKGVLRYRRLPEADILLFRRKR